MENQPGTYLIVFSNGQPSIETITTIPLDNRDFVARGGSESQFTFKIDESSEIDFAPTPIVWEPANGPQPPSGSDIGVTIVSGKEVQITVTPPQSLPSDLDFPFGLQFSNDTSIPDPTIVEKPPDGPWTGR